MENQNQKCISVRWVCSVKQTDKGPKPKPCLVACGCEEDGLNTFEKESPTASKDTLKTLLSTIITNNWNLKSIDIKTAFLQGEFLKRDVYLKPPPEAHCDNNQIWKLNKCVYGLTDASLMWFKRVKKFVDENNGMSSITDPALFIWHHNDKLFGVMTVHVDDFLCAGTDLLYRSVILKLRETFSVGREENCNFRYLGLNIQPEKFHIAIDQNNYIEQLKKVDIDPVCKFQKKLNLSDSERDRLRAKIGQLLWISNHTRPDISCDVSILASKLKDATINEFQTVNKLINKIKDNQYILRYQPLDLPFK